MGSTALYQVLMIVLTVCVWRGDGQVVSNTPSWPTRACSFTRQEEVWTWENYYTTTRTLTTEDECESWCLSEARCGSYAWSTVGQFCFLYQLTPRLMENLTGIPQEAWRFHNPSFNMGSKDCEVDISDFVCDNYIGYDRKYPDFKYRITRVSQFHPHYLTAVMCQSVCDAHDTCVSVWYSADSNGWWSYCTLYNITIRELIDSGREDEVYTKNDTVDFPIWITYDCDDITDRPTLQIVSRALSSPVSSHVIISTCVMVGVSVITTITLGYCYKRRRGKNAPLSKTNQGRPSPFLEEPNQPVVYTTSYM